MTPGKISLNSCSGAELKELVRALDEKAFRADQIFRWLYSEKVTDIGEMTNLSVAFRAVLAETAELTLLREITREVSRRDGSTKFLFELPDGERIEAVLLKDGDRVTACISTQVGCRMGCKFCATAQLGFRRHLLTAEILEQIRLLEQESTLTNIVFMGMGEPLDNPDNFIKALEILMAEDGYGYSHRRLTVSTVGLTPKIPRLFEMDTPANLAVSINAPNQRIRSELMPISVKYPLNELMDMLGTLPIQKRKRITLEYVLLSGINDSEGNAKELLKLTKGLPVKINLIRWNSGAGGEFKKPEESRVLAFQKVLTDAGMTAFIRKSLGSDIKGACGQLAAGNK